MRASAAILDSDIRIRSVAEVYRDELMAAMLRDTDRLMRGLLPLADVYRLGAATRPTFGLLWEIR